MLHLQSSIVSKESMASNQLFEIFSVCDRLSLRREEQELVKVLQVHLLVLPSKWNFRFVGFISPLKIVLQAAANTRLLFLFLTQLHSKKF